MKLRNIFIAIFIFFITVSSAFAEQASMTFEFEIPEFFRIETVTNAVLTANITDKTGNLQAPLSSRFRVISNSAKQKVIYLKSESITENGNQDSIFQMGGQVYIAFNHVNKKPTSEALINCKMGTHPKYSPGVVAYPITSIVGAKNEYRRDINRYQILINNGVTDILVNVGSFVLPNSFDKNDPKGFYQATLSLTESEI